MECKKMKQKQIDEKAGRVGSMMRPARRVYHLSLDDAAALLYVTPDELFKYERGWAKIPADILAKLFVCGYKTLHFRVLENKYRSERQVFARMLQNVPNES